MSNFDPNRTVHARVTEHSGDRWEIVRYDRAGKYYIEPLDAGKRHRLTLAQVVEYIVGAKPQGMIVVFYENRYGGQALNAAVRRAEAAKK